MNPTRTKVDPILGQKIHKLLLREKLENPAGFGYVKAIGADKLEKHTRAFCKDLGLDLIHPSTSGTPLRLAKMYRDELCWGLNYDYFPKCMTVPNEGSIDEIVLVKDITVKSLCEHHFMPVLGKAHVAYIPNKKLLGLSKFNRVVEFFSRRPQLQERLSSQILCTLQELLDTVDVAVIINAEHLCVKFRGIEDQGSSTTTSNMGGRFKTDSDARNELMSLIRNN